MKEQPHILYEDLKGYLQSLEQLADTELLTLKGHLLLEACLRRLLAVRMEAAEKEIPRVSFPALARLVAAGTNPERALPVERRALLLNQIRNEIAHRLQPREKEARIREFVALVLPKRDWTEDSRQQVDLYRTAIQVLIMEVQLVGLVLQMTPDELASLEHRVVAAGAEGKDAG